MASIRISGFLLRGVSRMCTPCRRTFKSTVGSSGTAEGPPPTIAQQIDVLYSEQPPIPEYKAREGEPTDVKLARLLYQSRKRGMLENGLLLSSFADRFLSQLGDQQLNTYDTLINLPSNDWDIYYWISGLKPPPPEFQSDVMTMIQDFVRNEQKESRFRQPDLKEPHTDTQTH